MVQRCLAAQSVLDAWQGHPFAWGTADCAHLASAALVAMGHPDPLAQIAPYASERQARKALKALGYAGLASALDALGLERIAPAHALPADLCLLPSESSLDALGVALGEARALAFCEGACQIGDQGIATVAWRVPWRPQ